ncbi:MAG TPA: hypothetical protein VJQ58_00660 [Burkholderiales bacterium]|nr:hypothetical protein [Burkholderiales bacterium]
MRLANAVAEKVVPISREVADRVVPMTREIAAQVGPLSQKAYRQARHGAQVAYRAALDNPRTSIAGVIVAAALVGGLLYWMFGNPRKPVERRRKGPRVRAVSERRKRSGRHATA